MLLTTLSSSLQAASPNDWSLLSAYGEGSGPGEYEGPLWPLKKYNRKDGIKSTGSEDEEQKQLLMTSVQEIFELEHFWFNVFPEKEMCTDELFNSQAPFIQYLFRLISLSYSYETLKDIHLFLAHANVRGGANALGSCNIDPPELWKGCRPKYVEMQKFIKRAQNENQSDLLDKMAFSRQKKALDEWWQQQVSQIKGDGVLSSISSEILRDKYNNLPADQKIQITDEWSKKELQGVCQKIKNDMKNVCNEKDFLFGMSNVPEAKLVIERSHAFTQINKSGHGSGCLRRFVHLLSRLEKSDAGFQVMFPAVMQSLLKQNAPYLQGKLFLMGSLQEFEEKGLVGWLYEEKEKPVPVALIKVPVKKVPLPTPTPKAEVVVTKVVAVATPTPTPAPKISQFETAVQERFNLNLDRAPVNMQLMRLDFPFTDKMVVELSGPIKNFQTRQALKDMRELDKLGTRDEPLHLMFLKFLIENDYHQGLFNIQSEIGHKFWVVNDFEKGTYPQLIELVNDQSTQHQWQIYILRQSAK